LWKDYPAGLSQKKKKIPNEEYLNMYREQTVKHFSSSGVIFETNNMQGAITI